MVLLLTLGLLGFGSQLDSPREPAAELKTLHAENRELRDRVAMTERKLSQLAERIDQGRGSEQMHPLRRANECPTWCNMWTCPGMPWSGHASCQSCSICSPHPVPSPTSECDKIDDAPPSIIGNFKGVYTGYLPANSTKLVIPDDFPSQDLTQYHSFEATFPASPYFVVMDVLAPCPDGFANCVNGFATAGRTLPCTWIWSCRYLLYCAHPNDVGYKVIQPTGIDEHGRVTQYRLSGLEMGPAHLLSGGMPNPLHKASVWQVNYERI